MPLSKAARRKLERLGDMIADLRTEGEDPEEDESEYDGQVDEILTELREIRRAADETEESSKGMLAKLLKLEGNPASEALVSGMDKVRDRMVRDLNKALDKVDKWESASSGYADRLTRGADRLSELLAKVDKIDRVADFISRPVYVVFDRSGPPHAYLAAIPATTKGLEAARKLRDLNPSLMISNGIWQGAIKIGEAVE